MAATSLVICKMAIGHLGDSGKDVTNITTPVTQHDNICSRWYSVALDQALTDIKPSWAVRKDLLTLVDEFDEDSFLNGEWSFVYLQPSSMVHLEKILGEGAVKNQPTEDYELVTFMPDSATPDYTETDDETITFEEDPGWYDGIAVQPNSTGGGLTSGNTYYAHRIDELTFSLHTTYANAIADASRVNLTASITATLAPTTQVTVIATNTEDAYADYIYRVTTTTLFPESFTIALSYLLASFLAMPVIKGKAGVEVSKAMIQLYEVWKNRAIATEKNQQVISELYSAHIPEWIGDR